MRMRVHRALRDGLFIYQAVAPDPMLIAAGMQAHLQFNYLLTGF